MRFKESNFEIRCNELWNRGVVNADMAIRGRLGGSIVFFIQPKNIYEIYWINLEQYHQAAISVIANLVRQLKARMFDDTAYVVDYIQRAIKETRRDFGNYRAGLISIYGNKYIHLLHYIDFTMKVLEEQESKLNSNEEEPLNLFPMMTGIH